MRCRPHQTAESTDSLQGSEYPLQCPFCAETIQDAAILCRFCGAEKVANSWEPPKQPLIHRAIPSPKGQLTFQITGAFLLFTALMEILSVSSPVPLFGAMRGGGVAWGYHLMYVGLLSALAESFLRRQPWGYRLSLVTTLVVSIDRAVYLLDGKARDEELMKAVGGHSEVLEMIGEDLLQTAMVWGAVATLLSWWALMAYVYIRRAYFQVEPRGADD